MMQHGSQLNPPNRFERIHAEPDDEHLEWDQEYIEGRLQRKIEYLEDTTRTIVVQNDSPDIPFRYSVNPYRGCVHACPYCYARNTHEYLGMNAGLDFETRIFVKHRAPELFNAFLSKEGWVPEPIVFSGVTDCYQPAERKFQLTRKCLEIAEQSFLPVGMITKNALVVRDLDILKSMASRNLIHINISITTLDPHLARIMEPRTSIPKARLRAVKELRDAGVPVRVMVAPLIPGLNDHEAPAIMKASKEAGPIDARYTLLRLPLTVEPVFREWLERTEPLKAEKVQNLIRQTRGGKFSESQFGKRMKGSGLIAEQIKSMFSVFRQKYGFENLPRLDATQFVPPVFPGKQLKLF